MIMTNHLFDQIKEGILAKEKGQMKDAARLFLNILQEDMNFVPALIELALLYDEQEEFDRAESYFQRALSLDPDHFELRLHYANSLIRKGSIEPGIDQIRYVLEKDENHCDAWYYLAITYFFYLNENVKALAIAERIIEIDPGFTAGYTLLGEIYFSLKNIPQSLKYFQRVLEIEPTNKDAHLALSAIYGKDLMDRHKSLKHSMFLLESNSYDKLARHNAEMALRLPPNQEIQASEQALEEGMAYLYLEKWDLAEHALKRALKLNPEHPEVWKMLQKVRSQSIK